MRMQHARRQQAEDGFFAVDHQCVTGIVATLKAHHTRDFIGQPIDDLALAFIAPLGADDDDISCHVESFDIAWKFRCGAEPPSDH